MILAPPRIPGPFWLVVNSLSPGPGNNYSSIRGTVSRDPETETGTLESEKRVHGIHGTLETGLRVLRFLRCPRFVFLCGHSAGFLLKVYRHKINKWVERVRDKNNGFEAQL